MEIDMLKKLINHYSNEFRELDEQIDELSLKRKYIAETLMWLKEEMNWRGGNE